MSTRRYNHRADALVSGLHNEALGRREEDGTWGPCNFQNDDALDMVEEMLRVAMTEIEAFCASDRVDGGEYENAARKAA
jgi:hypothetical protein